MYYIIETLKEDRFGDDKNAPYSQKVTINTSREVLDRNNEALKFLTTEMRFLSDHLLADGEPLHEGENFINMGAFLVFAMLYGFFKDEALCTHCNTIIQVNLI